MTVVYIQLKNETDRVGNSNKRLITKITRLQVQAMDQILEGHEGLDPKKWLKALEDFMTKDPKITARLKAIAFDPDDLRYLRPDEYAIYCNPVDDNPEPYEVFTLLFKGNECTEITRHALTPW